MGAAAVGTGTHLQGVPERRHQRREHRAAAEGEGREGAPQIGTVGS